MRRLPAVGAVVLFVVLAATSVTTIGQQAATPTPSLPPQILYPAAVRLAPGDTIVFADLLPPYPTLAPGQTLSPAGCSPCIHSLIVRNDADQEARVGFDGRTLDIAIEDDVVLQLFSGRVFAGFSSRIKACATGPRQNHVSCQVELVVPFPSLDISFRTVPPEDAGDQIADLPTARFQNIAIFAASQGSPGSVPMLMVYAGNLPVTLHWDEMSLDVTAPPGFTPLVLARQTQAALPCTQTGDQVNEVSCPIDVGQMAAVQLDVRVPAGWTIVGAPAATVPPDSGPLYTLSPDGTAYVAVLRGALLQPGVGYSSYNATPVPPRPQYTAAPASVQRVVPPGQFAMVGNERQVPVCVHGASVVYVYDPSAGYVENALLQPGQGGWAVSDSGLLSLDGYPATPCP
jgi:hypothetical protein